MITFEYTAIHAALTETARRHRLQPHEVRVLVALLEHSRPARTDELEVSLNAYDSVLRRALLTLYSRGLATGVPRTRGQRTVVSLTETGREIAREALAEQLRVFGDLCATAAAPALALAGGGR